MSSPTQFTYAPPGHHGRGSGAVFRSPGVSRIRTTVHTQMTFRAPTAANTWWMCRHAATNTRGETWRYPHEYEELFISCANESPTGAPSARTAAANWLR